LGALAAAEVITELKRELAAPRRTVAAATAEFKKAPAVALEVVVLVQLTVVAAVAQAAAAQASRLLRIKRAFG
jgi:hypothetical protein